MSAQYTSATKKNGARGIDRAARATRAVPPVAVPLSAGIEGTRIATDTAFAESGTAGRDGQVVHADVIGNECEGF